MSVATYGVFINIGALVDGLAHISEISVRATTRRRKRTSVAPLWASARAWPAFRRALTRPRPARSTTSCPTCRRC